MMIPHKDGGETLPVTDPEISADGKGQAVRKAAAVKSRTKALARRLRKGSRMASLTADISTGIERVAGLADSIAESCGVAESRLQDITVWNGEKTDLSKNFADSCAAIREDAETLGTATEESACGFARISEMLRDIYSTVQESAESHSGVLKTAQELSALDATAVELIERTGRLTERAEVAVVNAALDADRAGQQGAEFALLADAAQKYIAVLIAGTDECTAAGGDIRTVHQTILDRAGETSERIRAVGVVAKGARNALKEGDDALKTLCEAASGIMSLVENLRSSAEDFASGDFQGTDTVRRAQESIHNALSLVEEQELQFAGAADQAERLLSAAGALGAARDITEALDEVYTETDSFIRSVETTLERLDLAVTAMRDAVNETESVHKSPGLSDETIGGLATEITGSEIAMTRYQELAGKIRNGLADTSGALKTVANDLGSLASEGEGTGTETAKLGDLYRAILHFIDTLIGFSARMDMLAAQTSITVFRVGADAPVMGKYPPEFAGVAADTTALARMWRDYLSKCGELVSALPPDNCRNSWKKTTDKFSTLVAGIDELADVRFEALAGGIAALRDRISTQSAKIAKIRTKANEAVTSSVAALSAISDAAAQCEEQKMVFHEITASAEKISTLADEIYPDEV